MRPAMLSGAETLGIESRPRTPARKNTATRPKTMDRSARDAIDAAMMARCIALSKTAGRGRRISVRVRDRQGRRGDRRDHQPGRARRRRHAPCRDRRGIDGAEGARHQGPVGLHALHQCRALRDVLVPDPRDADQPRRLRDRLAADGRRLQMGRARRPRTFAGDAGSVRRARRKSCAASCGARPRRRGATGIR